MVEEDAADVPTGKLLAARSYESVNQPPAYGHIRLGRDFAGLFRPAALSIDLAAGRLHGVPDHEDSYGDARLSRA